MIVKKLVAMNSVEAIFLPRIKPICTSNKFPGFRCMPSGWKSRLWKC